MNQLNDEIVRFRRIQEETKAAAQANAALLKIAGLDLDDALSGGPGTGRDLRIKIKRLLERERLKGLSRNPNYDLAKHIGLKSAFDILLRRKSHKASTATALACSAAKPAAA